MRRDATRGGGGRDREQEEGSVWRSEGMYLEIMNFYVKAAARKWTWPEGAYCKNFFDS